MSRSVGNRVTAMLTMILLGTAASATGASAQTTTCMAMGPDMMTCDTTGPSSGGDGGASLGAGIGALIAKGREKSFNKKVGAMLANGDCEGAARFALEKGRLELGRELLAECRAKTAPQLAAAAMPNVTSGNLAGYIQQVARSAKTPFTADDGATVTDMRGIGAQLLITTVLKAGQITIAPSELAQIKNDTCATQVTQAIVQAGGSVRVVLNDQTGKQVGAILTTARDCGV